MPFVHENVKVELFPGTPSPIVYLSENDVGDTVAFELVYKGQPVNIPDGSVVKFKGTKKNGLGFTVDSSDVSGNVVEFIVSEDMTSCSGVVEAEISITLSNNKHGTCNVVLIIEKNPHSDGTQDGSYPQIVSEMRELVEQIEGDAETASNAANTAVAAKNSALEIQQDVHQYTASAIDDWLDNHPEATTTVQDGSLTYKKLVNGTLGFVTPEMFGAKGDGETDDTDAFQMAIVSGLPVYLQNAYLVTDITNIVNDLYIFGTGSVIADFNDVYIFSASNKNIKIDGISFDFKDKCYGLFTALTTLTSLHIQKCNFKNAKSYTTGYIASTSCIYSKAKTTIIKCCKIIDCSGHGIHIQANGSGSSAYIIDNYIDNSNALSYTNLTSAFGIGSYQSASDRGLFSVVKISGNYISGILGSCIAGHSMNNQIIESNTCLNGNEHGIVVQDSENCIVSNNNIDASSTTSANGACIRIQKNSETTNNIKITNNTGIGRFCVLGGWSVSNVYITENTVINNDLNVAFALCKILGVIGDVADTSHDIYISNNICKSANVITSYIYNDKVANYNLFVGWNLLNDEWVYGITYSRWDISISNILAKSNGLTNEIPHTCTYGNENGVTFQTNNNGVALWLDVSKNDYDSSYTKVGMSYDQSLFTDTLIYGIRFFDVEGTTIKTTETFVESNYVLDYPCNGHYNVWFDIKKICDSSGINISDVASLRFMARQPDSPNKDIAFTNVHTFVGQEYLAK